MALQAARSFSPIAEHTLLTAGRFLHAAQIALLITGTFLHIAQMALLIAGRFLHTAERALQPTALGPVERSSDIFKNTPEFIGRLSNLTI